MGDLASHMGLPTLCSATYPIHLEEGCRTALRDRRQHMDGHWDGDCGLLALQHNHGCLCHPQREQERLARGQLPQGLGETRKGQRALRQLRYPILETVGQSASTLTSQEAPCLASRSQHDLESRHLAPSRWREYNPWGRL